MTLQPLGTDLWVVQAPIPRFPFGRVMTVVRCGSDLLLHSVVALDDYGPLEALGTPRWMIVPGGGHRMDAPTYKERYPELQVYCPAGARRRVAQVVPVDRTYGELPVLEGVKVRHIAGLAEAEGVVTVEREDGTTLVFNDLLFDVPHKPGFAGTMLKLLGSSGGPRVTLVARASLIRDVHAVAGDLARLAETEGLVRLVPGHERPVTRDASAVLARIAAEL